MSFPANNAKRFRKYDSDYNKMTTWNTTATRPLKNRSRENFPHLPDVVAVDNIRAIDEIDFRFRNRLRNTFQNQTPGESNLFRQEQLVLRVFFTNISIEHSGVGYKFQNTLAPLE